MTANLLMAVDVMEDGSTVIPAKGTIVARGDGGRLTVGEVSVHQGVGRGPARGAPAAGAGADRLGRNFAAPAQRGRNYWAPRKAFSEGPGSRKSRSYAEIRPLADPRAPAAVPILRVPCPSTSTAARTGTSSR